MLAHHALNLHHVANVLHQIRRLVHTAPLGLAVGYVDDALRIEYVATRQVDWWLADNIFKTASPHPTRRREVYRKEEVEPQEPESGRLGEIQLVGG